MTRRFAVLAFVAPLLTAQNQPGTGTGPHAPLIARERFFAPPEIAAAQISPDGKLIAFIKPWKGVPNVWVKKPGEPASAARLMTAETHRPVSSFIWSRDGKHLCFVADPRGDGNSNLFAVEPGAAAPQGADAPRARNVSAVGAGSVRIYSASKSDPDVIYVGVLGPDKSFPDLYQVKASATTPSMILANPGRVSAWFLDAAGKPRLAVRTADNGDYELARVDSDTVTGIYACSPYESCMPLSLTPDGSHAYIITNKGAAVDLSSLALLDLQSGQTEIVETDPKARVDLSSAGFSERTGDLLFTAYDDDRVRRYFRNKEFETDFQWLSAKLGGKEVNIGSASGDERLWLINSFSDTDPGEIYLFDRKARTLALEFRMHEALPREELAAMQPIHYQSDGLDISAYLLLPKGVPATGLAAVVLPHNIPWTRDSWGYNGWAQFFANRGYAVLMPNYRGSSGYGKKFLQAGNGEWGRKMQDDLTAGVQYLVSKGIADPKRVGIFGSSYGGYAALAGAAFTPGLYHAAIDIAGSPNLFTMLDSIPPAAPWESVRKMMYLRTADPNTPEGRAWLKERSPLNEAAKIKAALLIVHGVHDTQVTQGEVEQLVSNLRDRKVPVEYLLLSDEGHGVTRPVNQLVLLSATEKFLAAHLGGRFEGDVAPEVTKRLAEVTVDPASLKKPDDLAATLPHTAATLKPGVYKYQAKFTANEREVTINMSTTIEEQDGAWVVTEVAQTPAGASADTSVLDEKTLAVRKRTIKQGTTSIDLDFTGGRVSGKISSNGRDRTVSADLGGPLFADAAGSLQSIGCLPLAKGFNLRYRNFDLQTQKTKFMQLNVVGSETVTVPAGTFDAFRVEITAPELRSDKAVVWIAKETRQPVKIATTAAAMNGATMIAEMVP